MPKLNSIAEKGDIRAAAFYKAAKFRGDEATFSGQRVFTFECEIKVHIAWFLVEVRIEKSSSVPLCTAKEHNVEKNNMVVANVASNLDISVLLVERVQQ